MKKSKLNKGKMKRLLAKKLAKRTKRMATKKLARHLEQMELAKSKRKAKKH